MYRNYWGLAAILAPGALFTLTLVAFDPSDTLAWILLIVPWTMGPGLFFFPYRIDVDHEVLPVLAAAAARAGGWGRWSKV